MNNIYQENKSAFLFLLALLTIFLIILYSLFFRPLIAETKEKELDLTLMETEVSILEVKKEKLKEVEIDTSHLETKIPLNRDLRELLLTLQNIEKGSNSHIHSIQFNYTSEIPTVEIEELDVDVEENESSKNIDEAIQNVVPSEDIPNQLEVIDVRMTVNSPDFEYLKQFVKGIEALDRITIIRRLDFTEADDLVTTDENEQEESITFTIDLLTFYYPN